jgi:hypothetical protein
LQVKIPLNKKTVSQQKETVFDCENFPARGLSEMVRFPSQA